MNTKCVFCSFANNLNLISDKLIRQTKELYIMLDANPQSPGHTLVITRSHISRLVDLPVRLQAELLSEAIKMGEELKQRGAKAYIIKVNNELYKLETLNKQHLGHIHFHVIPRYKAKEKNL